MKFLSIDSISSICFSSGWVRTQPLINTNFMEFYRNISSISRLRNDTFSVKTDYSVQFFCRNGSYESAGYILWPNPFGIEFFHTGASNLINNIKKSKKIILSFSNHQSYYECIFKYDKQSSGLFMSKDNFVKVSKAKS